jgi:fibronectin type 3 domain-containing protein
VLVEHLEPRCLLCLTVGPDGNVIPDADGDYTVGSPALVDSLANPSGGGSDPSLSSAVAASVPALSSRPGAPASIYLNFGGDTVANWLGYSPGTVPAFSGTSTTMEEIWQEVAENYSPFNLNVTTVQPTSGEVSQIDIGGNGSWTGGTYGGIAQVGGMSGSSPSNPVRGFVFPDNLGGGYYWYVADASTHESGHNQGLQHQSAYSGTTKTNEYQSGPGDGTAPTMGNSYGASRSMWWYGQDTISSSTYQNDLDVISSNPYGYAPLATGTTAATAHPLTASGGSLSASGVLESMSQTDDWSFTTSGGALSFTVSDPYSSDLGANYGNLHPKLEITDASGNVVVNWQDTDSDTVSWSGSLAAGSYRVVVGSHGISSLATASNYGFDVGSYTISGTVGMLPGVPTGVTATAGAGQVTVSWNPSGGATSYNLYRATTSGSETLYQTGVTASSFTDTGLTNGTTYFYEVSAVNSSGETGLSSEVQATPNSPPTLINPASTETNPVTGLTANLSVLGQDHLGETLTYSWTLTSEPSNARPSFSDNNSTTADNTTVTFDEAGDYTFLATFTDTSNLSNSSSVTVHVHATETSISVSPTSASVNSTASQQFSASAKDQFGRALTSQPTFTWTVDSGGAGGTISGTSGLYTAPSTTVNGSDTVRAGDAVTSGTAVVHVVGLPATPTNLVATGVSTSQINLTWTDNAGNETSYSVERSTNGTSWTVIASNLAANTQSFVNNSGLSSGATYYYRVRCFAGSVASAYSNVASAAAAFGAPAAPTNLAAQGVSSSQINLTWTDSTSSFVTAYEVLRSTTGTGSWSVLVNNLPATATSYSDTHTLTAGTTYYYEVLALNHTTLSSPSTVASTATWPTAPSQPGGLTGAGTYNTANPAQGAINLVWQDKATNETSYSVERSTDNKTWSVIATLPAHSTSYADTTGLTLGATYYYRVRCFNGPSPSAYSSSLSVVATPTAPAQPGTLTASATSSTSIKLTWVDKANNESGYSVERSTDNSHWSVIATLVPNSTSYADTTVSPSTRYYYRVRAFDGPNLFSNYSSTASATTPAAGPLPTDIAASGNLPSATAGNGSGSSGWKPSWFQSRSLSRRSF